MKTAKADRKASSDKNSDISTISSDLITRKSPVSPTSRFAVTAASVASGVLTIKGECFVNGAVKDPTLRFRLSFLLTLVRGLFGRVNVS